MKILGIDYSLNGTGLSILDDDKIIYKKVFTSIKKNYDNNKEDFILSPNFETTMDKIDWVVSEIISSNNGNYDFVAMEDHIGSYYEWMDGYGIIKHYLRQHSIPYIMISPTALKKYAGNGKAKKEDMIEMLKFQYQFDFDYIGPLCNNIVDATWLAITGKDYYHKYIDKKEIHLPNDREEILYKIFKKNGGKI